PRPHVTWVAGLVRQSAPALDILDPGSACGIPYALELGLSASTRQLLSLVHRLSRHVNSSSPQPPWAASERPIARAEPGSTETEMSIVPTLMISLRGSVVTVRVRTVRDTSAPPRVWTAYVVVASPTRPDWTTTRCPFGRFGSSTSSVVKGSTSVTVVADAAARLTRTSIPSTAAASRGADVLSPSASTMPAVARTPRTV